MPHKTLNKILSEELNLLEISELDIPEMLDSFSPVIEKINEILKGTFLIEESKNKFSLYDFRQISITSPDSAEGKQCIIINYGGDSYDLDNLLNRRIFYWKGVEGKSLAKIYEKFWG